jgi:hypothetical protein
LAGPLKNATMRCQNEGLGGGVTAVVVVAPRLGRLRRPRWDRRPV